MDETEQETGRMEHPSIISVEGVTFMWPERNDFRLDIPGFRVAGGERVLLTGPSGSGKTTLLNLLCGTGVPAKGSIEILGTRLETLSASARDRFRAEHIGVIFQMFNLLPYGSALDNVILPLSFAPKRWARADSSGGQLSEARRLLTALDLAEHNHTASAATLSIGQQQRVAAARALIGAPELLIADEPTSALDRVNQERFLDLLFSQLTATGTTLIMVSHDDTLAPHFDRVVDLGELIRADQAA
jgi:putative ABC transport system ATP-binding protein